jgi:hypothetical protein
MTGAILILLFDYRSAVTCIGNLMIFCSEISSDSQRKAGTRLLIETTADFNALKVKSRVEFLFGAK